MTFAVNVSSSGAGTVVMMTNAGLMKVNADLEPYGTPMPYQTDGKNVWTCVAGRRWHICTREVAAAAASQD